MTKPLETQINTLYPINQIQLYSTKETTYTPRSTTTTIANRNKSTKIIRKKIQTTTVAQATETKTTKDYSSSKAKLKVEKMEVKCTINCCWRNRLDQSH